MRVCDLMTRGVVTVDPAMPIDEAARLLAEHHVAFAPVVANWSVVGAIEASDVASCSTGNGGAPKRATVADVMPSVPVPRLSPDDELVVAATRLALTGTRRGVVFQNSRLVGVLSTTDIVRALNQP